MKKLTPKTEGKFAATKAKVRSLKDEVKLLTAELHVYRDTNDGLRKANVHASTVCGDAQNGVKLLKAELLGKCEEVNMLNLWNENLKASLKETETHRDNLYEANQKFAEDDHAYRLSSVKNINQLTNDNLHLAEEVQALKAHATAIREGALRTNDICNDELNKRDLKVAALQQTLDRERASHTMTFLAKCERIDELLLNDRELTNRVHSLDTIIARRDDQITALFAELRTHETKEEGRDFASILRPRAKSPSLLSRVWQWLNSPY